MINVEARDASHLVPVAELIGEGQPAGLDLAVSPDGQLTRRDKGINLNFSFRFRNRPFDAAASVVGDRVTLSFAGEFGVLPFTLEDRGRRARILTLLPQLRRSGLACEITRNQRIRLGRKMTLQGACAPREILAVMIEQLILARESFDAMADVAYVPPPLPARRR